MSEKGVWSSAVPAIETLQQLLVTALVQASIHWSLLMTPCFQACHRFCDGGLTYAALWHRTSSTAAIACQLAQLHGWAASRGFSTALTNAF